MKNTINPSFSKLILFVFHADTLEQDPAVVAAELKSTASVLQNAVARVREWKDPPTTTREGREVFYTYANSVHQATQRLVAAIESGDNPTAASQLEQIASSCNSCHHFFRLKIKDSIVPSR